MWGLPALAGGFAAGIVVLGDRVAQGLGGALVGLALACAAGTVAVHLERRRSPPGPAEDPDASASPDRATDPRERILRAAGFPARPPAPVRRNARGPGAVASRWGAAIGIAFLLGGAWGAVRAEPPGAAADLDGATLGFEAVAASDLRRFDHGWGLEARLTSVDRGGRPEPAPARVWLRGRGDEARVEAGQPLRGRGSFRAVDPDASGFASYLHRRGVAASVSLVELEPLGPATGTALRLANRARRALTRGALAALPDREAGLLLGLTIGDTSRMHPEIEEDFRATGLGHLVAVSGSNVVMVLAPVLGLAMLVGLGPRSRFLLGGLTVAFFALVTRWEPSVLRASVMAVLTLLGILAGRPRDTATLLGAAALLLLMADPRLAHALAFQLSVAATAGIVATATALADRMRWLPRPLAVAAGATIGAQAAVTPLLLANFGIVPSVALLANVLAFPAVGPAFTGGAVAAGAALLWPGVGAAVGKVAALPIAYLTWVADRTARLPLPALVGLRWMVPVAVVGVTALLARRLLRRWRRPAAVVAVLLAIVGVAARVGPPDHLMVVFLDVGQGDAAVVRTPEGATVLIDAGPEDQEVATKLAALGITRIHLAVASHAHADHVEGFPAVFSRHPVDLLLEPGCPGESPSYRRMLEAARYEEVPVRHPRGGELLRVGSLLIEVLGPDECTLDSPNDDSVVLLLTHGDATVLFPGDAEIPAQQDLLSDGDPVEALVLKVPHHGSRTSDPRFFDAVGPAVAVVSVGENTYGHPVPETLEALREVGATVLRTDLGGDIMVRFTPEGIHAEPAR